MSEQNNLVLRDQVWEEVLEILSSQGRLNRFFKLPRHEKRALLQLYSRQAYQNMGQLFVLTQQRRYEERRDLLASFDEFQIFAMLNVMVRSMQCWAETDGAIHQRVPARWKIAHA